MPVGTDVIGTRGEAIVTNLLTRRYGRDQPFFRPQFLGDKYPTIDFFVELVGPSGPQTPFFLVQVKSTSSGYTRNGRLKMRVTPTGMNGLVKYPSPTYVIGVDEELEVGFIVAALTEGPTQYRSFPTTSPLADEATLRGLFDEVEVFWSARDVRFSHSTFN